MDITVFASLVTGGAFLAFLQFLIQRHDSKKEKESVVSKALKALEDRLEAIEDRMDKDRADHARVRILRTSDECRRGVLHSQENLSQTLDDINEYRRYCKAHPNYENRKCTLAIENIEHVYKHCLEQDDFL